MTAGDRARVRRIADGIVAANASYRRRVRWAIAAGAAVAAIAVLPSLLVLDRPRDSAAAGGSSELSTASSPSTSGIRLPSGNGTIRPDVITSQGLGGVADYVGALRRWRPRGDIRVYRASTTPALRAELRTELGSRVRFVRTTEHAAILQPAGTISLPRASSTRGSSS